MAPTSQVPFCSEVTKEGSAARSGEDRFDSYLNRFIAGWSNLEARQAHYLKVSGSNPLPATQATDLFAKRREQMAGAQ